MKEITLFKKCLCGYSFSYNHIVKMLVCPKCKTEYKKVV